jgi:hypothetical protein
LSKVWRRLRELFRKQRLSESRGVLLPAWKSVTGETPPVSFETLVSIYVCDPAARAAVDFLADQTVGAGFYVTADLSEAKAVVDSFNEAVNMDELLLQTTREVVAFGNSFWEKIEPERLETMHVLPVTSVERIVRDVYGNVQGYKQSFRYGGGTLEPGRIVHFRWNMVDGEAFGSGVLRTLAESLKTANNEARPSFASMKAGMERSMTEIMRKYAGPTEVWKFEGLSDDRVSEYAALLKSMPREGARFVVNTPVEVEVVGVDPRSRFDGYVEHVWNQYVLGLQTPLPKLFTTPGFTEASAKAAIQIAERKVSALQRFMKRIVEREVFAPVISQAGIDPREAKCRLNWGQPEKPVFRVEDVLKAFEAGAVSADEVRAVLVKAGWELLSEKEGE